MTSAYLIAEAGANHNGDLGTAKALIDVAVKAEADCVKFQALAPFDKAWMPGLKRYCEGQGIDLLFSAFDMDGMDWLYDHKFRDIKIASAELVNDELLSYAAYLFDHVILSTGMASEGEIEHAVEVVGTQARLSVLHCVSKYPAEPADMNLNVFRWYTPEVARRFDYGLSDHTPGTCVSVAAVALGARIIEKHFTLDRYQAGPDHHYALEPDELRRLVAEIRAVEAAMSGDGHKAPVEGEAFYARGRRLTWE
jgi:sialic acid synthase SpsE